jgi:hypothetical protein
MAITPFVLFGDNVEIDESEASAAACRDSRGKTVSSGPIATGVYASNNAIVKPARRS